MNLKAIKEIFSFKNIATAIALIIFDLVIYIFLGLALMNYDDFYNESKGEYWSLASMNIYQKATYIGLNIWHLINIATLVFLII